MTSTDIPDGFERHFRQSPLTDPWEPLYSKRTDKAVIIGLRLAKPQSLVTIGLAVDFVGTAKVGQWLAIETDVIKTGSTICFAQSLVKADDVVIARANGTFRVVPKKE